MTPDPQSLIARAEKALEGVARGPWRKELGPDGDWYVYVQNFKLSGPQSRMHVVGDEADVDFWVAARTLVPELVEALKQAIRETEGWLDSAKHFSNGQEYYSGQLDKIAYSIGHQAFVADDGSVSHSPLRAKLPELVDLLIAERDDLKARLENIRAENAELREIDRVQASMLGPLRAENVALNSRLTRCIKALDDIRAYAQDGCVSLCLHRALAALPERKP